MAYSISELQRLMTLLRCLHADLDEAYQIFSNIGGDDGAHAYRDYARLEDGRNLIQQTLGLNIDHERDMLARRDIFAQEWKPGQPMSRYQRNTRYYRQLASNLRLLEDPERAAELDAHWRLHGDRDCVFALQQGSHLVLVPAEGRRSPAAGPSPARGHDRELPPRVAGRRGAAPGRALPRPGRRRGL